MLFTFLLLFWAVRPQCEQYTLLRYWPLFSFAQCNMTSPVDASAKPPYVSARRLGSCRNVRCPYITFGPDGYIHCWLNKSKRIGEAWFPEISLNLPPDLTLLSCVSQFFSCPILFLSFRGNAFALLRRSECLSVRRRMADFFLFSDLFELKWSVASTRNLWNVRRLADPTASYWYHQQYRTCLVRRHFFFNP